MTTTDKVLNAIHDLSMQGEVPEFSSVKDRLETNEEKRSLSLILHNLVAVGRVGSTKGGTLYLIDYSKASEGGKADSFSNKDWETTCKAMNIDYNKVKEEILSVTDTVTVRSIMDNLIADRLDLEQ